MGPDIPMWVFYGMIGMLLERGKIVEFVADRLPNNYEKNRPYRSLQAGGSHWGRNRG